jgi:hypothetical protein
MSKIVLFALAPLFLSFGPEISSGAEMKPVPLVLTRINETFYQATAALTDPQSYSGARDKGPHAPPI